MLRHKLMGMALLGVIAGGAQAASPQAANKPNTGQSPTGQTFVAHEWGTLLTMNGSDGVVLDSMYHEEHALPAFVHSLSKENLLSPDAVLKFETPVIYFYTDRPMTVDVSVKFPTGIWTHWFPQADRAFAIMARPDAQASKRDKNDDVQKGCLHWHADLLPPTSGLERLLPPTSSDSLWNFARQTDAAFVRTLFKPAQARQSSPSSGSEMERYLFYRGLGHANLPLEVSAQNDGSLSLPIHEQTSLTHLFIMRVEKGRGAFRYVPALQPGEHLDHILPDMSKAEPLADFATHVGDALAARLQDCGLYAKEARAMVNTWRSSYFQSEGTRVLYVLPQSWTDKFIPLHITPTPDKIVRVMVGRTELLTPEREREVAQAARNWNSALPARRDRAAVTLHAQGRYLQPILRRLAHTTNDPTVRAGCRDLLHTAWVNELHPAALKPAHNNDE